MAESSPRRLDRDGIRPLTSSATTPANLMRNVSHTVTSKTDARFEIPIFDPRDPLTKHLQDHGFAESLASHGSPRVSDARESMEPEEPIQSSPQRSSTEPVKSSIQRGRKPKVSFLNRLSLSYKKKIPDEPEDVTEDDDDLHELRVEGASAPVFAYSSQSSPHYPSSPVYIRTKSRSKPKRDFDRLFLAQQLRKLSIEALTPDISIGYASSPGAGRVEPSNAIWALELSNDGRFLAAGGDDKIVRIWSVLATRKEREKADFNLHSDDGAELDGDFTLECPVFQSQPTRELRGHLASILSLSWSKNNFLLSASMDKTVKLWHTGRSDCLLTLSHPDLVTSIAFHPTDDRFFLAGSLDSRLRLWSIPDKTVTFWTQVSEVITAVGFTPEGKTALAGSITGTCLVFDAEGLKHRFNMSTRSTLGLNTRGAKITGIETFLDPPNDAKGDIKVVITSNDSRIRLFSLRDRATQLKFKGNINTTSQIRASISDDGKYVVCGSEDKQVYVWSCPISSEDRDRDPACESFTAHDEVVTAAIMVPERTRKLLHASGDPIYELCNPPPFNADIHADYSTPPTPSERSFALPESYRSNNNMAPSILSRPSSSRPKLEGSSSYQQRCGHPAGHIIITADLAGNLKVFRQDCSHAARARLETNPGSRSYRKVLNRTGSAATRGSQRSMIAGSLPSASDRIMSWRAGVGSSHSTSSNASPPLSGKDPSESAKALSNNPKRANTSPIGNLAEALKENLSIKPAIRQTVPDVRRSVTSDETHLTSESMEISSNDRSSLKSPSPETVATIFSSDAVPAYVGAGIRSQLSSLIESRRRHSLKYPNSQHVHPLQQRHYLDTDMHSQHQSTENLRSPESPEAISGVTSNHSIATSDEDSDFYDTADEHDADRESLQAQRCPECGSEDFKSLFVDHRRVLECSRCGMHLD